MLAFSIAAAVLAVGGALAWIGLILLGARQDGHEQQFSDSALRR